MTYTKFRIEATHDDRYYKVSVKGWFGWKSGFVYTSYFSMDYDTLKQAEKAIEGYKNRFKEIE